jgi:DNA-directed RNA polymerase sigma subunit (sigma70/sigma32)
MKGVYYEYELFLSYEQKKLSELERIAKNPITKYYLHQSYVDIQDKFMQETQYLEYEIQSLSKNIEHTVKKESISRYILKLHQHLLLSYNILDLLSNHNDILTYSSKSSVFLELFYYEIKWTIIFLLKQLGLKTELFFECSLKWIDLYHTICMKDKLFLSPIISWKYCFHAKKMLKKEDVFVALNILNKKEIYLMYKQYTSRKHTINISKLIILKTYTSYLKHVINHYKLKHPSIFDIIEESTSGLIKSIDKFQLYKKCRFLTYASWWVEQPLQRFTPETYELINVPENIRQKIIQFKAERDTLYQRLGREPTEKELSESLQISTRQIKRIQNYTKLKTKTVSSIDIQKQTPFEFIEYDKQKTNKKDKMLYVQQYRKSSLNAHKPSLPRKYLTVLSMHLGIYPYAEHSNESILYLFNMQLPQLIRILAYVYHWKVE